MQKNPSLFALFVGIDSYHPETGIAPLRGAVHDACALARTFGERFAIPADHVLTLLEEAATRAAILDAFAGRMVAHAARWAAGHDEGSPPPHFVFYFAGYGAQVLEQSAGVVRTVDSLVAYDSRLPGAQDLVPVDFAAHLEEIAAHGCSASLILDCGHMAMGEDHTRAWAPDLRAIDSDRAPANGPATWDGCGVLLLAAARWGEAALERMLPEADEVVARGQFSLALQQLLNTLPQGSPPAWDDFTARLVDRVAATTISQTPRANDGDSLLFGGTALSRQHALTVFDDDAGRMWLDVGVDHDVQTGCRLVLVPDADRLDDATAGGIIEVTAPGVDRSACILVEGSAPSLPAHAVIVQPGSERVRVRYAGGASERLSAHNSGTLNARVNAVAQTVSAAADFVVAQGDDALWICSAAGEPLSGPFAIEASDDLRIELAHRARFAVAVAQRGGVAELPSGSVSLELERLVFDDGGFPHGAPLEKIAGELVLPGGMPVVIHVTNNSDRALDIALFRFGPACAIAGLWPQPGTPREILQPGASRTFGCSPRPVDQVHTPLPAAAVEARLTFRVYASTSPMAAALLEQGPLAEMFGSTQAGMSSAPLPPNPPWVTDERGLRLLPPAGSLPHLGSHGAHVAQMRSLPRIETPAAFVGALQWLGPTAHARQEGAAWPAGLAAHPGVFRPYYGNGADAGGGVAGLAITCSEASRAMVCADAPLRLHVAAPADGALLAFAWDGVNAYPVGCCPQGGALLDVTWLPPAVGDDAEGARAAKLERTIRIYFCEVRGAPAADVGLFAVRYVPAAWAATASRAHFVRTAPGGELRYTTATRARPNERIALLIHGFADDSVEEAHWLAQLQGSAAAPGYDRILSFEWESLHTDVRANAERLRDAVAALALEDAPGAEIDLFAHSMGALVARAYVELLGGDSFVRRCFFTGPPNAGTPLAATALFTPWLLTMLINLPAPTPPALLIAWALGVVALDMQGPSAMHPDAALLHELNRTRGHAHLRYHILAGNAQAAPAPRALHWRAVLAQGLHTAADWFYEGENDWVVGVRSCLAVPMANHPGSVLLSAVVDCTHLTYYRNQAATAQLVRWLAPSAPTARDESSDAPANEPALQAESSTSASAHDGAKASPVRRKKRGRRPAAR